MNGGRSEREGHTESETGSRILAVSTEPDAGLELTDREIVTRVEVGHLTDRATQAPQASDFGSGHDLTVREFEPRIRLCADSSEPGACFGFCVSLSLSAPPLFMLSLSVSKINKNI